jgi:hypothetical protein
MAGPAWEVARVFRGGINLWDGRPWSAIRPGVGWFKLGFLLLLLLLLPPVSVRSPVWAERLDNCKSGRPDSCAVASPGPGRQPIRRGSELTGAGGLPTVVVDACSFSGAACGFPVQDGRKRWICLERRRGQHSETLVLRWSGANQGGGGVWKLAN